MRPWRNPSPLLNTEPKENRRRHGRLRCDGLQCSLGEVINLSASGLCVECRRDPKLVVGQGIGLRLSYGDDEVPLTMRVQRVAKEGIRRYRIALAFDELDDQQRVTLTRLATMAAERRLMS